MRRLLSGDHSEIALKGLARLELSSPGLSSSMRAVLSLVVPTTVDHVVFASLALPRSKVAFNLGRHSLIGLTEWKDADRVDLQRLQVLSQVLLVMETQREWSRA